MQNTMVVEWEGVRLLVVKRISTSRGKEKDETKLSRTMNNSLKSPLSRQGSLKKSLFFIFVIFFDKYCSKLVKKNILSIVYS